LPVVSSQPEKEEVNMATDLSRFRERMVKTQLVSRGIEDPAVLKAMGQVPREAFVPPDLFDVAYDDSALPIGKKQTISQPYMVALMLEALELKQEDRVMEIGTGSGYAAAVLSRIVEQVFTIERYEKLAETAQARFRQLEYDNIRVHTGDGTLGWSEHAPYDGVVVTAGGPEIPEPLLDQLKVGGYLVIPIGGWKSAQKLVRVHRKAQDEFQKENLGSVRFVPLVGEEGWPQE
jgi:protein-L-isoaspartate(D-aspartate) O-methyltransferase